VAGDPLEREQHDEHERLVVGQLLVEPRDERRARFL
jgi:hypothetical protein